MMRFNKTIIQFAVRCCFTILTGLSCIHFTYAQRSSKDEVSHLGYIQGYYYDNSNTCIDGLIRFKFNQDNYVLFKAAYGDKSTKLKTKNLNGFVIMSDSFAVIRNFDVDSMFNRAKPLRYKEGFAQVLDSGEITLYRHQAVINFRVINTFLLSRRSDENKKYFTIRKGDSEWFAKEVAAYLSDDMDLSTAIKNKELQFNRLRQIVRRYNERYNLRN